MSLPLDPFDLKLLLNLQQDARQSQVELGAQIGLSSAAVNRRIKRLADEGVIEKFSVVVEPGAVGLDLTVIAQVEVESERIDLLDAMKQSFTACPQVQQCYYVAGEWDFVLVFAVQNMAQYTELTRALFFQNNNVKRFKTLVAMDRVKVGLDLALEALINSTETKPQIAGRQIE